MDNPAATSYSYSHIRSPEKKKKKSPFNLTQHKKSRGNCWGETTPIVDVFVCDDLVISFSGREWSISPLGGSDQGLEDVISVMITLDPAADRYLYLTSS